MLIKRNSISKEELEKVIAEQKTPENDGDSVTFSAFREALKELCKDKETFFEVLRTTPNGYRP